MNGEKLSRRQVMAARAITRATAARSASAALDPSDPARYHTVKRLGLAFIAPAGMVENPNRGKRNAARMDIGGFDSATGERILTTAERHEREARKSYAPLTVKTPLRTPTGRQSKRGGSPEWSQYTV